MTGVIYSLEEPGSCWPGLSHDRPLHLDTSMVISGTLWVAWTRHRAQISHTQTHTHKNSSFPCQRRNAELFNVANLHWWSCSPVTCCSFPKTILMHVSKGLSHTSSVAMVRGLVTIVRGGSRAKGWIQGYFLTSPNLLREVGFFRPTVPKMFNLNSLLINSLTSFPSLTRRIQMFAYIRTFL